MATNTSKIEATKRKYKTVKFSDFLLDKTGNIDVSRNQRHGDVYDDARFQLLKSQILEERETNGGSGVRQAPVCGIDPETGKLFPINGNQRCRAWGESVEFNPKAEINVYVIEGELSASEIASLMDDYGARPFREVDFFEMARKCFIIEGLTETQFVARAAYLLTLVGEKISDEKAKRLGFEHLNSPDLKLRNESRKKVLDAKKGTIQRHKDVVFMPEFVQKEWVNRLLDKQTWPSNDEVKELGVRWREETEIPRTGNPSEHYNPMYSRENPGPWFMERWNRILDSVAKAAELGDGGRNARKSTSMMANKDVVSAQKAAASVIVRITYGRVLNTLPENFPFAEVDKLAVELEKTASEDWKKRFAALCGITLNPPAASQNVTVSTNPAASQNGDSHPEAQPRILHEPSATA